MTKKPSSTVPLIRFPEFKSDWSERKAIKYFANSRKKGSEGLPIYSVTQNDGLVRRDSLDRQIGVDAGFEQNLRAEKDDLVYNMMRMWQGAVGKATEPCMVSPAYVVLSPRKTANSQFFLYMFNRKRALYWLWAFSYGLTNDRLRLYYKDFSQIPLFAPEVDEQEKIAAFLKAVDKKVAQLQKKRELLTQYKTGVMQQIFTQQMRFKDDNGNDFPDWVEERLSRFAMIYDGTHQTPNYVAEGVPFYSVEHVTSDDFSKTKFVSREVFEKENERVKLERGDILMTRIGDIGTCKFVDWDVEASFYVSLALIKCNDTVCSEFLSHYIHSSEFQRELHQRTIHVAFPRKINLGEIGKCTVKLPVIEEQLKISCFLTLIEQKLLAISHELNRLGEFKSGLLQQMFV